MAVWVFIVFFEVGDRGQGSGQGGQSTAPPYIGEAGGENWFGGIYREIEQHRRLVFSFAWDSGPSAGIETLVTITFEERDGKTVQTFHQRPFLNVARRDSHVGGWNQTFDKQLAYLTKIAKEHAA